MRFSLFNRALLPGMLAGSVVLTGYACSRPDRAESGSDNSSTVVQDSNSSIVQPTTGDTAQSNSPRAETAAPSERDAAGYRPMDRDTGNISEQVSDSARFTADTSATVDNPGSVEMARDTSTVSDQADTEAGSDRDTTNNAGRIRPPEDSTEILGQVITDSTAAVATADSSESVRVRPPEDSTEILGNVTSSDDIADETADEQIVTPDDQEKVAASEAPKDEVGAAAVANGVTGAEAVALMSREGVRCAVIDPETNEAVRWDMSSTPVTLNPCGMGSMNLSKIWTAGE